MARADEFPCEALDALRADALGLDALWALFEALPLPDAPTDALGPDALEPDALEPDALEPDALWPLLGAVPLPDAPPAVPPHVEPVTAKLYIQVPKPAPVTERPARVILLELMQAGAL